MNGKDLYRAAGGIDEKLIKDADAAKGNKPARVVTSVLWQKRLIPAAACLLLAAGVFFGYKTL
ncbi:MAG: hypothetical protein LBL15_08460, partial [Oscillospiraceae bacterium]|nr:hypothetical protein [Oscillospiraceae bacterium]